RTLLRARAPVRAADRSRDRARSRAARARAGLARGTRRGGGGPARPMIGLWYAIVTATLVLYVVLDGFDLGAGALHLVIARRDAERRQVLAAIGPYWDANEVWLVFGGAALFVAFPAVFAAAFSGFYLCLF